MKICKQFLTSIVAFAMFFTLLCGNVFAAEKADTGAENEGYTYQITIYAGNHGTFKDGSSKMVLQKDVKYNDVITIDIQSLVEVAEDSKYYIQGVRLSGRDNNDVPSTVFKITEDTDYVVAYGIEGAQVSYTVKYVDESGKSLLPDDIFYGNVGDKPVVAYKYIDGYVPKALGLTKTLSEDSTKNILTFVYVKVTMTNYKDVYVETEGGVSYIEQLVILPGGTTVAGGVGGATNVTGGGADAEEIVAGDEGDIGEAAGEEGDSNLIVDLDEETPLANIDAEGNANGSMAPVALYVGMGLLAIIAIIAAVYISKKLKKNEEA
jgi:hypothetical protein